MYIGLDLGTTNIKALLVDGSGTVLARAGELVNITHGPDGAAEQDMAEIIAATVATLSQLGTAEQRACVKAIGVSSQGGALQILNSDGQPAGPVISWLDSRGRKYDERLTADLGRKFFIEHTGHGRSFLTIGQIERLRVHHPELLSGSHKVGFVGDVVVGHLTGRAAHDATSASLAWLYNPSIRDYDPTVLDMLELSADRLPALLGVSDSAGGLLPAIAEATGLPEKTPVSPAVHDQYAAAAGSTCLAAGDVMIGTGTAWVLLAADDDLREPVVDDGFVCTHIVDGLYGQMLSLVNGGSSFAWARDLAGLSDASGAELDAMMASVPVGTDGLRMRPTLAGGGGAGLTFGDQGVLVGMTLAHKREHLLRAAVEGLACELTRYLQFMTARGLEIDRLVMTGSAAGSAVTPQVIANVAHLPVTTVTETDTSAFGAAVIARSLVDDTPLAELSAAMVAAGANCHPDTDAPAYAAVLDEYLSVLCELSM
jgi:sugar (pentulose or hexulose) kinase